MPQKSTYPWAILPDVVEDDKTYHHIELPTLVGTFSAKWEAGRFANQPTITLKMNDTILGYCRSVSEMDNLVVRTLRISQAELSLHIARGEEVVRMHPITKD